MGSWKEFPTTADTGLEVKGKDLSDLFSTAGMALAEMITNPSAIKKLDRLIGTLNFGDNVEELFVIFLQEILFYFDAYQLIPIEFVSCEVTPDRYDISVAYGKWDESMESRNAVKAITYHHLLVEEREDGWFARVVFDV